MKILIIQDFLRSGGTERQTVLLANSFAAAGHATTLLTFRPGGALAPTVEPAVTVTALQRRDRHLDWFKPGWKRAIERIGPDVILCMGRMANCHGGALQEFAQRRWPHTRVLATMRTGKQLPWLFRRSLRRVAHIVANSVDARDTLVRDHDLGADKISVVHNSLVFPPAALLTRNESLRARHGATPTTTVLLCSAMFRPEKNQRELIEIVAGLPRDLDWQLWLAGDGPVRSACERLAARKNIADRVTFHGFQRDPSPLYRAADLAVHASWSEALSNFLIEAQAHGLPVVAYKAQGIRECFMPGRTGWAIARDDREAFRSALLRQMNESAHARAALASEARSYARESFDPTRQVAAYLELFHRLA